MKSQREEGGGRILRGDNTSGGAFMLWPVGFACAGVWISIAVPCVYVQYVTADPTHDQMPLAQHSTCVGLRKMKIVCKLGVVSSSFYRSGF